MYKVSIIIPVYNVEKYLKQCLDSVEKQTYKNLQIICINDGSTDSSLKILEEYAKNDDRYIVYSQKNQGVSVARNKGIDLATGDYIAFLDPDDWIKYNTIELAIKTITKNNSDIVIYSYYRFTDNTVKIDEKYLEILKQCSQENDYSSGMHKMVNIAWDKLYKRDFIKENNIYFPLGIHPAEDTIFSIEVFLSNPKTTYLLEPLYYYRTSRKNSAMNKSRSIDNSVKALKILLDNNFFKNADVEYQKMFFNKILSSVLFFYKKRKNIFYRIKSYYELRKLNKYLQKKIPQSFLNDSKAYKKIQTKLSFGYILEHIFSVKNEYKKSANIKHKVITLLGIKIKRKVANNKIEQCTEKNEKVIVKT